MKKALILFVLIIKSITTLSQDPKRIELFIYDTLSRREDFFIRIKLHGKNGQLFEIPINLSFGILTHMESTFQIMIQKKEKRFVNYFSDDAPSSSQSFHRDSIKFKSYIVFETVDSLRSIGSLDSGRYRIKIFYNKLPVDGEITYANNIISSKWHYFYVRQKTYLRAF